MSRIGGKDDFVVVFDPAKAVGIINARLKASGFVDGVQLRAFIDGLTAAAWRTMVTDVLFAMFSVQAPLPPGKPDDP